MFRTFKSMVGLMTLAVAVLWILAAPAQACFSRGVVEGPDGRTEDLSLSAARDTGSFALVRLSHATFPSDAGIDQSELLMYRIINETGRTHSARLLFEGPALSRIRVEYMSVPALSAPRFVRELQSSIQDTITDLYSDDLWRLYQVEVDIIDTTVMPLRIEFNDSKWFRSRKTILPDLRVSIWDVFDPGRTQSLRPLFGCGAKALAVELQDPSFGLSEDLRRQLADLQTKPRIKCDLYLRDPFVQGTYLKIRTKGFEFQCGCSQ